MSAGEFKTHFQKLMDWVNRTKQPITITKHGKPMAVPTQIEDKAYSLFGCLENTVEIKGDIIEGTGEVWEINI